MKTSLVLAFALMAGPALAQMNTSNSTPLDGSNPDKLAAAIKGLGYTASVSTDAEGYPMIEGALDGSNYYIYFYGCDQTQGCNSIQFVSGYDLPDGMSMTDVNEWHRAKRFGRVELDDEMDPFITMPVNLDFGVSVQNFEDTFDYWTIVMREFEDFIGWQ